MHAVNDAMHSQCIRSNLKREVFEGVPLFSLSKEKLAVFFIPISFLLSLSLPLKNPLTISVLSFPLVLTHFLTLTCPFGEESWIIRRDGKERLELERIQSTYVVLEPLLCIER